MLDAFSLSLSYHLDFFDACEILELLPLLDYAKGSGYLQSWNWLMEEVQLDHQLEEVHLEAHYSTR